MGFEFTMDFTDNSATLGDRIATARENLGLSYSDIAARLGVKETTVQNWENDRSEPRANKLQMLAGVLRVSMIWLMTGQDSSYIQKKFGTDFDPPRALTELSAIRADLEKICFRISSFERELQNHLDAQSDEQELITDGREV